MALVRTTCPECSAGLKSESGFITGETVCCPNCETFFTVGGVTASGTKQPARTRANDAGEEDYLPKRTNQKKFEDEDDDGANGNSRRSYKNSPLRFAILGMLIVTMLVMGYFLYEKKMNERRDAARDEEETATAKETETKFGGPILPLPGGGPKKVLGPRAPGPMMPPPGANPKNPAPKDGPGCAEGWSRAPKDGPGAPKDGPDGAPLEFAKLQHVSHAGFSPNGRRLVTVSRFIEVPQTTVLQIWDATTGKQIARLSQRNAPVPLPVFSPDSKKLACLNWDLTSVLVWDFEKGGDPDSIPVPKDQRPGVVNPLAFSPDGIELYLAHQFLYRITLADHAVKQLSAVEFTDIPLVAFSPATPEVVVLPAGSEKLLAVDLVKDTSRELDIPNVKSIKEVVFSGDGQTLGLLRKNAIELYDAATWKLRTTLRHGAGELQYASALTLFAGWERRCGFVARRGIAPNQHLVGPGIRSP